MSALCRQLPVEVLEVIFTHVTSRTLFKSVRLVCKRWYSVSRRFIPQNLVWNDNRHAKSKSDFKRWKTLEDVLDGLFNINNNSKLCRTRLVWTSNGDMTTWSQLVVALARLDQECQAQDTEGPQNQSPGQYLLSPRHESTQKVIPLTELVLTGECNFQSRFSMIEPHLRSLTSLQLHVHNTLMLDLDLDCILFQTCPAMASLYIRGGARPIRFSSISMMQKERESRETSPFRLNLKSLVLHYVKVDQVQLEHYLSLSPYLLDLRLIELELTARRYPVWRLAFISHIQQCTFAPYMKSFHLSFARPGFHVLESLSVANIHGLLDFESVSLGIIPPGSLPTLTPVEFSKSRLSKVSDWGFELSDITPAFKSSLFKVRNLVTSLTLISNDGYKTSFQSGLHDYLCASPLLLYLYTDRIVFEVASLDPYAIQHRRKAALQSGTWSGTLSEYDALMAPRGIWACRNLKALHAHFSGYRLYENRWATRSVVHKDMTHAHTRVVFGYLTKVCPNLEELHVVLSPADLELQSGLCLLSRLKRLERLEIAMSVPNQFWPRASHAWDWMAYRKTRLQAWLRAGELVLWESEIRDEEWQLREESMEIEEELAQVRLEADLSPPAVNRAGNAVNAPVGVPRLSTDSTKSQDGVTNMLTWDDLSQVGKLSDVREALKDLYADWRTPCWPMLEEIRIYGSLDVQTYVQSMVDSLRGWPRAVQS